jgi:hypothetical protein
VRGVGTVFREPQNTREQGKGARATREEIPKMVKQKGKKGSLHILDRK